MSPRLVLRLDADPDAPPGWLRQDGEGRIAGQGTAEDLADLAARNDARQIIALAPGTRVLLTRASVPTQSRQKLLKALPYALEDQLADDIDRLHFVPGRRNPDGSWAVAVVERAWLDTWLARLAEHDLTPERLIPETLCLPWEPGHWTVLADERTALVRTGEQSGFAGDTPNLDTLLSVALDEPGVAPPEGLLVLAAGEGEAPLLPPDLENVAVSRQRVEDVPSTLARRLDAATAINLLTGDYASVTSRQSLWRPWAAAAVLFAIWLVLDTGQALLDQRAMRAELAAVDAQTTELLREVFPQARDARQARTRLESRLEQVRGGARPGDGLLDTLAIVGPVLAAGEDVRITGLSWRSGSLELELNTVSLQGLDQLKQTLDGTDGISAEVRSARTEDEQVQGRLTVTRTNR